MQARRCNAADWDGKAMPRPPSRTKQVVDAAGRLSDDPYPRRRGRARHRDHPARSQPAVVRQDRDDQRSDQRVVRRRHPDIVAGVYLGYDQPRSLGGYAQGGRIAAPIFKQFAQVALQGHAAGAVRRAARNPHGSHRPRQRRRVFGSFPITEDPKSSVIWEAFQPETEPRRSFRRGGVDDLAAATAAAAQARRAARPRRGPAAGGFLAKAGRYLLIAR